MKALFISIAIVVIDQITKFLIKGFSVPFLNVKHTGVLPYSSVPVINNLLEITNIENPGIAFGWYWGDSIKPMMTIATLLTVIVLVFYLRKISKADIKYRVGLGLIIGGAIGNLIDRIFYGEIFSYAPLLYGRVVDFIQIRIFEISLFGKTYTRFPIFNIADIAVTFGVIFVILFYNKSDFESVPFSTLEEKDALSADEVIQNEQGSSEKEKN
jgi:signal peptidase II